MPEPELESLAAKVRSLEEQLQRGRRQRMIMTAAGLAAAVLISGTVASSDPPSPLPCGHGGLYCFGAGQPALAAHVNSNFEALAQGVDAASAAAAAKLPLAGGTLTGNVTFQGSLIPQGDSARISGGNTSGNLHIDSVSSGDGRIYLNWNAGKGVVIGNGAQTAIATFTSSNGKATIAGRRVPSETVGANCATASCTAICPAGTTVKLAWGFHGNSWGNAVGGNWACGSAFQWLGNCIGGTSCTVSTGCGSSSVFLECW